jgi:hypothetical protein
MDLKRISRICGGLYVSTVLAFLVSNVVMKVPLLDAGNIPKTLQLVAGNAAQYRWAVAIDFVAMVAVMALVFSLFAILKTVDGYLALVALGLRIGEVVLQSGAKAPDFLLLRLSQSAVASSAGVAQYETVGAMLFGGSTQLLWLSFVFLSIGNVFNNFRFYRGKLIPAGLAIFGIVAAGLYAMDALVALVVDFPETVMLGIALPLVLFKLILGIYLMFFGVRERSA